MFTSKNCNILSLGLSEYERGGGCPFVSPLVYIKYVKQWEIMVQLIRRSTSVKLGNTFQECIYHCILKCPYVLFKYASVYV